MKFILSFVFLAAVCLQANSYVIRENIHSTDVNIATFDFERSVIDELVNQAQNAYEKLKNIITENLTDPIKDITDLQGRLGNIIDDAIAMLKELYAAEEDNIIAEVNKMVDCYKGEAERLGINIKDCYNAAEDQILNMPVEFIKNLTTCATDEYDGAMELVDSALGIYDSIIDELKEFPDKIVSCTEQGWWSAPTCVIGVITDIAGLALKIPTTYAPKLVELSAKLGVYISGMTVRVQICGSFKTTILAANAMSISSNFIGCVKNKFPEPVNCLNA